MAKKAKKPLKCPFCGKVPDISETFMNTCGENEWNLAHYCKPDNWAHDKVRMVIDLYAPSPEELIDLWNTRVEAARRKPGKPDKEIYAAAIKQLEGLKDHCESMTSEDFDEWELDVDALSVAITVLNSQCKRRKPKKPDVDPGDDFFGAVCNCAVRYSLGRQSYMPGLVQDFLRPLLPKLNAKTLAVMERDIRQAPSYGDPAIDRPGWLRFLSDVRKVMDDKGIDPVR